MNWSYKTKALLICALMISSALFAVPFFAKALKISNASANTPGCLSGDSYCLLRDPFSVDALGSSPYNSNQWEVVSSGSYSASLFSNPQQGLIDSLTPSSGSGQATYGIVTRSAYSFASQEISIAVQLSKFTTASIDNGYEANLLFGSSLATSGDPWLSVPNFIRIQISDSVSGSYLKMQKMVNGYSSTLWASGYSQYDWVVYALQLSSSGTLNLWVNSYNPSSSASGQWLEVYTTGSSGLNFNSGYVYLYQSSGTDGQTNTMTSQFASVTYENPVVDASIGMSLAYMARAYQAVPSANSNPMAVILDVPGPALTTLDLSGNSAFSNFAGQPGVTNTPTYEVTRGGGNLECVTNPCQPLGTRALSLSSNGESLMYTFAQPYNLANLYVASLPPYISIELNETSNNPLSTTYTAEELYYSTGDRVQVWLGNTLLFDGNQVGHITSVIDPVGTFGERYVARHITRVASNIFNLLGYGSQGSALGNFMTYYGYNKDFYDSMVQGKTANYGDSYLWASSTFPDPSTFANLPTTFGSNGGGQFPYQSRLTNGAANTAYLSLLSQLSSWPNPTYYANDVPPEEDGLLALHYLWTYGYGNPNTPGGSNAIDELVSAMGWDGTGTRRSISLLGITANYPSYAEYDLAVFLTAVSYLHYTVPSNSTYTKWVQQALNVALGTQDMYQIEVGSPGNYVHMADQVGGWFGGYQYSPAYMYTNWQSSYISDVTDFLTKTGIFALDPPYSPGYGFTGTESSGLMLLALLVYDSTASNVIQGQILTDPQTPSQTTSGGYVCGCGGYGTPQSYSQAMTVRGEIDDSMVGPSSGTSKMASGLSIPFTTANNGFSFTVGLWVNGTVNDGSGTAEIDIVPVIYQGGTEVAAYSDQVFLQSGSSANLANYYQASFSDSSLSAGTYSMTIYVEYFMTNGASMNFSSPWINAITYMYDPPMHPSHATLPLAPGLNATATEDKS